MNKGRVWVVEAHVNGGGWYPVSCHLGWQEADKLQKELEAEHRSTRLVPYTREVLDESKSREEQG